MPLRYLLDEHLRGPLWNAVQRHNALGMNFIDVERIGDPADLPLESKDPAVLLWAERERRILLSEDKSTMSSHLADHLASGHRSPGVMILRPRAGIRSVLEFLVAAAYASSEGDWEDRVTFIP